MSTVESRSAPPPTDAGAIALLRSEDACAGLQPKIQVRNLNFYYGAVQALRDVNLDVFEQRVTAIIGPSGCGK